MKCPRGVEQNGCRTQVPIVNRRFNEHERAVKHAKEELNGG